MAAIAVFCTCPDKTTANRIAHAVIEERLAACVNALSGIESTYRWKDKVQSDTEQLLLIKTTRERFDALRDRIIAMHPYELPEVIAIDIALGLDRYLAWIAAEVSSPRSV
jgi:periplasmic divalent cation tolerance protein